MGGTAQQRAAPRDGQSGTATVVVRLRPERGVMLGNFGAAAIIPDESWVTDAEFLVGDKPHPLFPGTVRELFVRAEWRVWHADSFSRSGYSAFPDEADADARAMLGLPLADTLFFAGEAVGVTGQPGKVASVHGAIESGMQCAREVIAALRI